MTRISRILVAKSGPSAVQSAGEPANVAVVMGELLKMLAGLPRPFRLDEALLPDGLTAALLGPHPDDFDCVGVTMRRLRDRGVRLAVAVLSSGVSGVEDCYTAPPAAERKAAIRREEQRASCRFFGLPESDLAFLRLAEDAEGEPADTEGNRAMVAAWLADGAPPVVFLPHGHDEKGGHRNVYALFRAVVAARGLTVAAFLNRDPKTIGLRMDAFTPYGPEEAAWKARLLRFHDSQQQRNVRARGRGFDERILELDRRSATELGLAEPAAEAFEVELFLGGCRV
jgi:LmbE family N-acetylglucosaminyl deacetylase